MLSHPQKYSSYFFKLVWDTFCCASIVGIWPRYIEPRRLITTQLQIPLLCHKTPLEKLRIVHFSDLHFQEHFSASFFKKISTRIMSLEPHVIVFTGDTLTYSQFPQEHSLLRTFFSCMHAPYGKWAILGNHDYASYVSMDHAFQYHHIFNKTDILAYGLKRLWDKQSNPPCTAPVNSPVDDIQELIQLFETTGFHLLNNQSQFIPIGHSGLNITGLGDIMALRFDADSAFKEYKQEYPGITLCHNPDAFPTLCNYPGDIVLSGHTHGGQVNLPFLSQRFIRMKYPQFKSGLHRIGDKWLYVNRGIGSAIPFRWFSPPEITLLTLTHSLKIT